MAQLIPTLAERLPLLAELRPLGDGPPSPEEFAKFAAFSAPVGDYRAPEVETADRSVPGPHGEVPVRIYRPPSSPRAGLVWCHGGGFVMGDLDMPESDVVGRELAAHHGIVVVAVDYRLCHGDIHFPVPHDDVHAAYSWAHGGGTGDDVAWAIGGGSAGGNLAAGVAQRLRDEGGAEPVALALAYPVVHADLPDPSPDLLERVEGLPAVLSFPPEARAMINASLLGDLPADTPYAFPALGSVEGMAPTILVLPDHDDLGPSGDAFAAQLRSAGVEVAIDAVEGVPHGHLNIPGLPEALASIEAMAAFVGRHAEQRPS